MYFIFFSSCYMLITYSFQKKILLFPSMFHEIFEDPMTNGYSLFELQHYSLCLCRNKICRHYDNEVMRSLSHWFVCICQKNIPQYPDIVQRDNVTIFVCCTLPVYATTVNTIFVKN